MLARIEHLATFCVHFGNAFLAPTDCRYFLASFVLLQKHSYPFSFCIQCSLVWNSFSLPRALIQFFVANLHGQIRQDFIKIRMPHISYKNVPVLTSVMLVLCDKYGHSLNMEWNSWHLCARIEHLLPYFRSLWLRAVGSNWLPPLCFVYVCFPLEHSYPLPFCIQCSLVSNSFLLFRALRRARLAQIGCRYCLASFSFAQT